MRWRVLLVGACVVAGCAVPGAPGSRLVPADDGAGDGWDAGGPAPTFDIPLPPPDAPDVPRSDLGPNVTCEGAEARDCYTGAPGTRGVGLCSDGFQRCVGGRWADACNGENLPQIETCNGVDDDCDGTVDDIVTAPCYTGPAGTANVGVCRAGTYGCQSAARVCAGQVVPQVRDVCGNGTDDDCDGTTDEGC